MFPKELNLNIIICKMILGRLNNLCKELNVVLAVVRPQPSMAIKAACKKCRLLHWSVT